MLLRSLLVLCVIQTVAIGWLLGDRTHVEARAVLQIEAEREDDPQTKTETPENPKPTQLPFRYRLVMPNDKVDM